MAKQPPEKSALRTVLDDAVRYTLLGELTKTINANVLRVLIWMWVGLAEILVVYPLDVAHTRVVTRSAANSWTGLTSVANWWLSFHTHVKPFIAISSATYYHTHHFHNVIVYISIAILAITIIIITRCRFSVGGWRGVMPVLAFEPLKRVAMASTIVAVQNV